MKTWCPSPSSLSRLPAVAGLLVVLAGTTALEAQRASVTGRIASARSGEPIHGAEVVLPDLPRRTVTSEAGFFRVSDLPAGRHVIRISYMGAESRRLAVELAPRQALNLALDLEMKVLPVPELVVTVNHEIPVGKLYEFRRRAENSPGVFITRDEIERRHASRTTDVLRQVPGLRVGGNVLGRVPVSMQRRGLGQRCTPGIYVDGAYAPFLDPNQLLPGDLAGIEVYRGPSEVPPEYRRVGDCGVLVFWTRDPGNRRGFQ